MERTPLGRYVLHWLLGTCCNLCISIYSYCNIHFLSAPTCTLDLPHYTLVCFATGDLQSFTLNSTLQLFSFALILRITGEHIDQLVDAPRGHMSRYSPRCPRQFGNNSKCLINHCVKFSRQFNRIFIVLACNVYATATGCTSFNFYVYVRMLHFFWHHLHILELYSK